MSSGMFFEVELFTFFETGVLPSVCISSPLAGMSNIFIGETEVRLAYPTRILDRIYIVNKGHPHGSTEFLARFRCHMK